jgi:type III secretion protein T
MEQNYLSLYVQSAFAHDDPIAFLSLMFLFLGRMLPIIALSPFFGAKVLPHPVKVVLALCLFLIFLPQLLGSVTTPLGFNFILIAYLMKEMFIGSLIGFMASIPFVIVQNTGLMIDHQRGASSLMVSDPMMQNQTSPLGTLFNLLLIVLFFYMDGPFLILDALSQSYTILPPDQMLSSAFFTTNGSMVNTVLRIVGRVMIISTQLASPALIMILMTDFFLGIANRLAPQVQITFLGMPLKSLLALAIIFFGWELLMRQMVTETYTWVNYIYGMVKLFQPSSFIFK